MCGRVPDVGAGQASKGEVTMLWVCVNVLGGLTEKQIVRKTPGGWGEVNL